MPRTPNWNLVYLINLLRSWRSKDDKKVYNMMLLPSYTDAGQGLFLGGISCLQSTLWPRTSMERVLHCLHLLFKAQPCTKKLGVISPACPATSPRQAEISNYCVSRFYHCGVTIIFGSCLQPIQCQQISTNGVFDGFCRIWFHMAWYVESAIANLGIEGISDQGTAAATGQERCSSKKATSAEQ